MLDHVNAGRMSLMRLVDLTSAGRRGCSASRQGRVAVGYDADLTLVDLKRRETIRNDWIALAAAGRLMTARRLWLAGRTFVRGARVMWQGELLTPSTGAPVRFHARCSVSRTRVDLRNYFSPSRLYAWDGC